MSLDPYADAIYNTYKNDLNYTNLLLLQQPSVREYDDLTTPLLEITYVKEPKIMWHAFGFRNVTQTYQVVYIIPNQLNFDPVDLVTQFKEDTISEFMGMNNRLSTAGAWQTRVEDDYYYKRETAREGYTYSSMNILVDYIFDNTILP